MNQTNNVLNAVKKMNGLLSVLPFNVPFLENFSIKNVNSGNIVFLAVSDDKSVYQLVRDDLSDKNADFDDRLREVIDITKKNMFDNQLQNPDKNLFYYSDFNKCFLYKIYIQNYIKEVGGQLRIVNQVNSYFVDPKTNIFYQLSLSNAPYLKMENVDIKTDMLIKSMMSILNEITYN